jgi:hypothetical protein
MTDREILAEAEAGIRFLGVDGRLVRWTAATRADHEAAILDFEAALRTGAFGGAEVEEMRLEIVKHRQVLAGRCVIFPTTHPDVPILTVAGLAAEP